MKTKGIRIKDKINSLVSVKLEDILNEIQNKESLFWSIQFFFGSGKLTNWKSIKDFEGEVNKSERGLLIKWKELNELIKTFYEVWGIFIIGCNDQDFIFRYENDQEMYENCDIVIELVDSAFWEVFSKDINLINRLAEKFKNTNFLDSDFLNK